ncbi:hypothetical protein [Bartonella ancashensis]|nr:hypothetical protein [Bartonella ancashensis]ALE03026.1 hypothetical protein PU02_0212 [Bartonella ancashensis]
MNNDHEEVSRSLNVSVERAREVVKIFKLTTDACSEAKQLQIIREKKLIESLRTAQDDERTVQCCFW